MKLTKNQIRKCERISEEYLPISITETAQTLIYTYEQGNLQIERRVDKSDGIITYKIFRTRKDKHGAIALKLEDYRMVFDSVDKAFQNHVISYDEQAILYAAIGRISEWQNNFVRNTDNSKMSLRQFALYLGKQSKWVNKHLHNLEEKKFLRIHKDNNFNSIEISPHIAWRGTAKNDISFAHKLNEFETPIGSAMKRDELYINTNITEVIVMPQNDPCCSTTDYTASSDRLHVDDSRSSTDSKMTSEIIAPGEDYCAAHWKLIGQIPMSKSYLLNTHTGERKLLDQTRGI